MKTNKQYRIDKLRKQIRNKQSVLDSEIDRLQKRYNRLLEIEASLDDPHALVPDSVSSIEKWIKGHPHPESVLFNIFKNKKEAYDCQLYSHTLMYEFKIIKCQSREYYKQLLKEEE